MPLVTQAAARRLSDDHRLILQLEQLAADNEVTPAILEDLKPVYTPAVRVLFLAFEEDGYRPSSRGGLHLLAGLLRTLPDSKIVEDTHSVLRLSNQHQQSRRQTLHRMQELVTNSKVLSSRNIPHRAQVDRDVFLTTFPRTKDCQRKRSGFLQELRSNVAGC